MLHIHCSSLISVKFKGKLQSSHSIRLVQHGAVDAVLFCPFIVVVIGEVCDVWWIAWIAGGLSVHFLAYLSDVVSPVLVMRHTCYPFSNLIGL